MDNKQRSAIFTLFAAIALDESNGLAMHRSFRYEVLKILHRNSSLSRGLDLSEIVIFILRKGGLFELSKEALKAVLKDKSSTALTLPSTICESHSMLVDVLEVSANLECLTLYSCADMTSLDVLEKGKLRVLWLNKCKAHDLSPLQNFSHLETLSITSYKNSNIQILKKLNSLTALFLMDCEQITDLRPIEGLKKLEWISLAFCSNINNINTLAELQNLEDVDLTECGKVSDLNALKKLRKLRYLNISGCRGLRDQARQIADLQESIPNLKITFDWVD